MNGWSIQFEYPMWLIAWIVLVPIVWLGRKSLSGLGIRRQWAAIGVRVLVIGVLVVLLAGPQSRKQYTKLSVVAIVDRSLSVPEELAESAIGYVNAAGKTKPREDRIGTVYAGEVSLLHSLPGTTFAEIAGKPAFNGDRTDLAAAVRIATAILPNDTARRIVLISDGNENVGDLRSAARHSRANNIPIDVVTLNYTYRREVLFERLVVPQNARTGQTISAKCILRSTENVSGKLVLEDNGKVIDLSSADDEFGMPVTLTKGTNAISVQLPIMTGGVHRFGARFIPDDRQADAIEANNKSSGVTFVTGKGRILLVDTDGKSGQEIHRVLRSATMDVEYRHASEFPMELVDLMEYDTLVLVNTANSFFSYDQQEIMKKYVHDLGGGLVMVGGPESFGAGGWIGSPLEEGLPVVLDPPQKQQMPKGALVMVMHSVEMPQGNYWGEQVAIAAARSLSRLDLVGVLDYDWQQGTAWVYPLSEAGDKTAVISAIQQMQMGDMPDFGSGLEKAYSALIDCDAAQKHVIIISDGDPSPPSKMLLEKLAMTKISVTGVTVFPHSPSDVQSLQYIAKKTGGRFYHVTDPNQLPKIYVKEAQVVRRPLIWEKPIEPKIVDGLSELTRGIDLRPPTLEGYIVTGEKKELVETVMVSPDGDPILASRYYGLGKTVAFTSDASSRWAKAWLEWGRFEQFWEQVIRWSLRSGESPNVHVSTQLQGQRASVVVDVTGAEADFSNFLNIGGVVVDPSLKTLPVQLRQVGPGRYIAHFEANTPGNHVINLQVQDGEKKGLIRGALAVPFAPEYYELVSNPAVLVEAADISGGRVLSGEAGKDTIFDHSGLTFPYELKPLWRQIVWIWLVLFLIDVGIRRVAIDPAAVRQWMGKRLRWRTKELGTDETVLELRKRQLEVRKTFHTMAEGDISRKRFEVKEEIGETGSKIFTADPAVKPADEVEKKEMKDPSATEPESYLDRLKRAKRKARDEL